MHIASLCTEPPPLKKYREGICDLPLLIVYDEGMWFFPDCVENDLIGCYL